MNFSSLACSSCSLYLVLCEVSQQSHSTERSLLNQRPKQLRESFSTTQWNQSVANIKATHLSTWARGKREGGKIRITEAPQQGTAAGWASIALFAVAGEPHYRCRAPPPWRAARQHHLCWRRIKITDESSGDRLQHHYSTMHGIKINRKTTWGSFQ